MEGLLELCSLHFLEFCRGQSRLHIRYILGAERDHMGITMGCISADARRSRTLVQHPELPHGGARHVLHRGHDHAAHHPQGPSAL